MTNLQKALKLLNDKGDVQYEVTKEGKYIDIKTSLYLGNGCNKFINISENDAKIEVERLAEIIEEEALWFD